MRRTLFNPWEAAPCFAALLAGLWLGLGLLAGSDAFHKWLHADPVAPGPSCVVCMLLEGQFALSDPSPVVAAPPPRGLLPAPGETERPRLRPLRLPPGRAPPPQSPLA